MIKEWGKERERGRDGVTLKQRSKKRERGERTRKQTKAGGTEN